MLTRRNFLRATAAAPAILQAQNRRKPNIVFILADDLGYSDLGCYGGRQVLTPHLDRLAADGMRFTQAYAGSTVCAPSRCGLMTGLHMGHARIRGNRRPEVALAPEDVTAAKVLREAGYRTGLFGKWGLGGAGTTGLPNLQGFDEFFGYLDQLHAHTSYPTHLWENQREFFLTKNFGVKRTEFSNDLFTERALQFVEQNQSRPFFLYLPYTIPHANNELTREGGIGMEVPSDEPYTDKPWKQVDKNFAASITRMDRDIGRVMKLLSDLKLDNNTLVLFSSDNGPHNEANHSVAMFESSGPLRGRKRDLYEGGIRVPTIARWTGNIRPGQVSDAVWAFWDFVPTAADAAGVRTPSPCDGISITAAFDGRMLSGRQPLYWEFHERGFDQAIRDGRWKAVRRANRKAPIELYDMRTDISEKNDVSSKHLEVITRMDRLMENSRTESAVFPIRERTA